MQTILMAVAVVEKGGSILLRKMDPEKSPYTEPWALFGGKIDGDGSVEELLNRELLGRWNFTVQISQRLWWDEEVKVDSDGERKRFVYIDAICQIVDGEPSSTNTAEELRWVPREEVSVYDLNPPTRILLDRLEHI